VDTSEVISYLEQIRDDQIDFIETADSSTIWSAIVRGFEEVPVLNISRTNVSTDEIIGSLTDASRRAYGSFLCTAELIVEVCPRSAPTVVQSLYKAFISPILTGHSNATSFLFNLLQDYKMYFPYTYTFCRRIGRSPTTTLQQWREYLYPTLPPPQVRDEIQNLSQDWDMSGLEEGEDSDGEDQKSVLGPPISVLSSPSINRKRTTRMSSAQQQRRDLIVNVNQSRKPNPNDVSADLLVQLQSSDDSGSILEIQDMSIGSPENSAILHSFRDPNALRHQADRNVSQDTKTKTLFQEKNDQRKSNPRAHDSVPQLTLKDRDRETGNEKRRERDGDHSASVSVEITIDDLRRAYSQSLEDDDDSNLAEKGLPK
jgi:hypothetical protein